MTRRRATHVWVLLIALLFTAGVTVLYHRASREGDAAAFENAVEGAHDRIANRLQLYVALLLAARGLLGAVPEIETEGFRTYVAALDLERRYPGALGIGFSLAVPREDRAAALRRLAERHPGLRVFPPGERDELHTIVFLEPLERRNRAALGFDMSTDPVRREAMARARDTGEPAASRAVTLVQEIDAEKQLGFLIYVPVYRRPAATVEERRRELLGFVYSPFRVGDLFAGIFGGEREPRVTFDAYQGEQLLFSSPHAPHRPRFARSMSLDVGGVMWGVRYESRAALDARSATIFTPWLLAAGGALSLLLFALTRAQLRARAEAEAQRANLRAIFEQAPAAMAIIRARDLSYELSNPLNVAATHGRAVAGRPVAEAVPELERQGYLDMVRGVVERGEPVVLNEVPLRLGGAGGERLAYVNGTYQPLRGPGGEVEGVMVFAYEVTDLVRARQVRDDFLSVAGHELRTPITALALQLDSLVRQAERGTLAVPAELVERLHKARAHVARVDRLVGELLDVARIGGNRLGLFIEEVDLAEVVRDVADRLALEAQQAGGALRVEAPEALLGRWDRLRLEQIVLNLLSNAVKYGGGQPIDVRVAAAGERVSVAVRDRGIGVPPGDRERIFDRFERAVSDRSYGGLGLGLWISRQLAAALGGTVTVAEAEGGGSVFTVELPREATATPG